MSSQSFLNFSSVSYCNEVLYTPNRAEILSSFRAGMILSKDVFEDIPNTEKFMQLHYLVF